MPAINLRTNTRHTFTSYRLDPELDPIVRRLVRTRGWRPVALMLRCSEYTLEKLVDGNGVTEPARDRIAATVRELVDAGRLVGPAQLGMVGT